MNRRLLIILLSAFVIAVGCSYLVLRVVGSRLGSGQRTTRVVAAAKDLPLGSVLRSGDLTTIDVSGTLPKGIILQPATVIGRGVLSNLYAGEPIIESRLAAPGSGGGLAATIPDGMRACAVKVDDVVGVAGFATPGMRVDVLISGNPSQKGDAGSRVRTLLQNIEVLSAGTDIQRDAEGKPKQVQVVNLLVTPYQAELLSLAGNQTHIQLALRNPLDTKMTTPPGVAMSELFGGPSVPLRTPTGKIRKAPLPLARFYLVEVFNGSKRSEAKFASHKEK
ncbi:MAG: Flp pilus assembly protein CpaB [Acidobacteriaceae bacterium]